MKRLRAKVPYKVTRSYLLSCISALGLCNPFCVNRFSPDTASKRGLSTTEMNAVDAIHRAVEFNPHVPKVGLLFRIIAALSLRSAWNEFLAHGATNLHFLPVISVREETLGSGSALFGWLAGWLETGFMKSGIFSELLCCLDLYFGHLSVFGRRERTRIA